MKQLQFRAWLPKYKEFAIMGESDLETLQSFIFHHGDSPYLQSATGLVDKNNNAIYEGDFLGDIYDGCVVYWCDACKSYELFYIDSTQQAHCTACLKELFWSELVEDEPNLEVIGNVYQGVLE